MQGSPEDELDFEGLAMLALAAAPSVPAAAVRDRVVRSYARPGRYGRFCDRIARLFDLPPDDAAALLHRLEDEAAWRPSFLPGSQWIVVSPGPQYAGAIATFAKFPPGLVFPRHEHRGDEITIVLDGVLRDSSGREIRRGEELFKPAGSTHDFDILDHGECIAAALAADGIDLL